MGGFIDLIGNLKKKLSSFGFTAHNRKNVFSYFKNNSANGISVRSGIIWDLGNTNIDNGTNSNFKSILRENQINESDCNVFYFLFHKKSINFKILGSGLSENIIRIKFNTNFSFIEKKAQKIGVNSKKFPKIPDLFSTLNFSSVNKEIINFVSSSLVFSYLFSHPKISYGSQEINSVFGKNGLFYILGLYFLRKYFIKNLENVKKLKLYKKKWYLHYSKIYDRRELTDDFFLVHSYFSLILKAILYLNCISSAPNDKPLSSKTFLKNTDFYAHFIPSIQNLSGDFFFWAMDVTPLLKIFDCFLKGLKLSKIDLFSEIYQGLISLSTRRSLGEFYTPKSLVLLMINKKINWKSHRTVLDPSCGSGSFLIEILRKKIKGLKCPGKIEYSINKHGIYGIDVNPIAVQVTLTNLILFLENITEGNLEKSKIPEIQIHLDDAIFPKKKLINTIKKVDLILGNPPWISISGIYSGSYKEKIKALAKNINILYGIEAKNTEICSIFFYQCRKLYLKEQGDIFFILPASILNGRQHVFFRYFNQFSDIDVWKFTGDIFKVHNICLSAKNSMNSDHQNVFGKNRKRVKNRLVLNYTLFDMEKNMGKFMFSFNKRGILKPAFIRWDKRKNTKFPIIGGYNPVDKQDTQFSNIIPNRSIYYKCVKGGIRIVPRRWVVIKERPPFPEFVKIHPDFSQQAKENWANPPYSEVTVESEYIHPFLKSQGLIPFSFVKVEFAFIPIDMSLKALNNKHFFNTEALKPKGKIFFRELDAKFRKMVKPSASMKTLAENFTYNGRLIPTNLLLKKTSENSRESHTYLVIHNSIGSLVKSTVLEQPILLDNSIYYFVTEDENEAYYLCGVLNSPLMTSLVKRIGSTGSRGSLRNIHKSPYKYPIPKYNGSKFHVKIAELSKKIKKYVKEFICVSINFDCKLENDLMSFLLSIEYRVKARKVQKKLRSDKKYKELTLKLNDMIKKIFKITKKTLDDYLKK
ncbi:MAG: HsdM family class I SAM-dependent methyltransferase [Promethearchaeota archaeon]